MGEKTLFHVTPNFNFGSIVERGVLPSFSRGKLAVSWWCDETALLWAVTHCSVKYDVPVRALVIFYRDFQGKEVVRFPLKSGLYTCKLEIRTNTWKYADVLLKLDGAQ